MQVSVEKISSVECRLTIFVPADQVEEVYNNNIAKIAKKANIKGFRPGKAPMSYIHKTFGGEARIEAINEVMKNALYKAITDEKLKPINTPTVEPKSILMGQPLEFTATFEVLPDIGKINFAMENIEKLVVAITPDDIKRVIEQLRKQYTQWQIVDRPAKEGDRVVIDYYSIFEGKSEEEHQVKDYPFELGSKTMLQGFEEGLIGAKTGEEKTLHLTFPANVAIKERAEKPVDFVVKIKQIFEANKPDFNEDFVKQLGIASGKEEDFTSQIKQTLELERNRLVKERLKEQVFKQLVEQNQIEAPKSLVAREAKAIHDEVFPHHKKEEHQHSNEEVAKFNEIATKRVMISLLISEYIKQNALKPDQDEVTKRIKEIASAYEKPQEVIDWLKADKQRMGIESQIMEDQVVEKLIENIPVVEKEMNYAELKGIDV